MRIFTKRFFKCSPIDQARIVDAAIADLEECIGRSPDEWARKKARQMVRRITRKAIVHGIYADEVSEPVLPTPAGSERPSDASSVTVICDPPYGVHRLHREQQGLGG